MKLLPSFKTLFGSLTENYKPTNKDYFIVKDPLVGSGKIKRKVYLDICKTSSKRNRRKEKANRQLSSGISKRSVVDNKIKFNNTASKRVFEFWNKHKHPFVIHKKKQSITTARIISKLQVICKKYEQRQIIEAIEVGHRLFQNPSFVYFHLYNKQKIGLHQFLEFTVKEKRLFNSWSWIKMPLKKYGVELPNSWFKECLKGWKYLNKKYCRLAVTEDKHPELTEQAIRMMSEHRGREINDRGKQDLIKFSKMAVNWGRLNKIDPYWLVDHIETALNNYKTMRIDKAYYLTTEIFWTETIRDELVRYDRLQNEGRDFVYDKDEMLK